MRLLCNLSLYSNIFYSTDQDLRRLLETAQANGESDISTDTAKPASHIREPALDDEESTTTIPLHLASPKDTVSTPRRNNSSSGPSGSHKASQPNGSYLSDDDQSSSIHQTIIKTPRAPGGWVTPSRTAIGSDPSLSMAVGQTPAPPGAWKATPLAAERKGILKVRFDESTAMDNTNKVSQDTTNALNQGNGTTSDVDDEPGLARAVRLVDSFGRERRFDDNGEEIGLPPVSLAKELSMSKRSPAVRLVDSMGNELDPSVSSPDNTSDLAEMNGHEILAKMSTRFADARKNIENIEARFVHFVLCMKKY